LVKKNNNNNNNTSCRKVALLNPAI